MTDEERVLEALEKPSELYHLQQRLDPSSKTTDALQDQLLKMHSAGKVKFDIKRGNWSRH